jgi:hypothetical protein
MGKFAWTLVTLAVGIACSGEEKTPISLPGGESGAEAGGEAPSTAGSAIAGQPNEGGGAGKGAAPSAAGEAGEAPVAGGGWGVGGESEPAGGHGGSAGTGGGGAGAGAGGAGGGGGGAGAGAGGAGGTGGTQEPPVSYDCNYDRTGDLRCANQVRDKLITCASRTTSPTFGCQKALGALPNGAASAWCCYDSCYLDPAYDYGSGLQGACKNASKPKFSECLSVCSAVPNWEEAGAGFHGCCH